MVISHELLDSLIADARAHAPNECCGLVAVRRDAGDESPIAGEIGGIGVAREGVTLGGGESAVASGEGPVGGELPEGRAVSVHPTTNTAASPLRFEMDGKELLDVLARLEREGHELGALYHSHTRTAPYPSQTDINFAALWPGVEWVIVGLSDPDSPVVRSYRIDDGVVREVAISH